MPRGAANDIEVAYRHHDARNASLDADPTQPQDGIVKNLLIWGPIMPRANLMSFDGETTTVEFLEESLIETPAFRLAPEHMAAVRPTAESSSREKDSYLATANDICKKAKKALAEDGLSERELLWIRPVDGCFDPRKTTPPKVVRSEVIAVLVSGVALDEWRRTGTLDARIATIIRTIQHVSALVREAARFRTYVLVYTERTISSSRSHELFALNFDRRRFSPDEPQEVLERKSLLNYMADTFSRRRLDAAIRMGDVAYAPIGENMAPGRLVSAIPMDAVADSASGDGSRGRIMTNASSERTQAALLYSALLLGGVGSAAFLVAPALVFAGGFSNVAQGWIALGGAAGGTLLLLASELVDRVLPADETDAIEREGAPSENRNVPLP